jgi:hypothetical protein
MKSAKARSDPGTSRRSSAPVGVERKRLAGERLGMRGKEVAVEKAE